MVCTVTLSRSQVSTAYVEHPDDWTDAQIVAAVEARVLDIMSAASWYDSASTAPVLTIAKADEREPNENGEIYPRPLELRETDTEAPGIVVEME